jgi:hypothetical protein
MGMKWMFTPIPPPSDRHRSPAAPRGERQIRRDPGRSDGSSAYPAEGPKGRVRWIREPRGTGSSHTFGAIPDAGHRNPLRSTVARWLDRPGRVENSTLASGYEPSESGSPVSNRHPRSPVPTHRSRMQEMQRGGPHGNGSRAAREDRCAEAAAQPTWMEPESVVEPRSGLTIWRTPRSDSASASSW